MAPTFKNSYYGLRHGESLTNKEGIIASSIHSQKGYTLTEQGIAQVKKTLASMKDCLPGDTLIVSSDFERTLQTAQVAAETLGIARGKIETSTNLRERYFGKFDKKSDRYYKQVWDGDEQDPTVSINEAEPVENVFIRVLRLIKYCEEVYTGRIILLVSHCDTLMILQAGFMNREIGGFRRTPYFKTGQCRLLQEAQL